MCVNGIGTAHNISFNLIVKYVKHQQKSVRDDNEVSEREKERETEK